MGESGIPTFFVELMDRQMSGEWQDSLELCLKTEQETAHRELVDLNVLICRYHLGMIENLATRALSLASLLTGPNWLTCSALAMAAAHKVGDLGTIKGVACELARHAHPLDPWLLPTVPEFIIPNATGLIVGESSAVEPVVEVLQAVTDRAENTPAEISALNALIEKYLLRADHDDQRDRPLVMKRIEKTEFQIWRV